MMRATGVCYRRKLVVTQVMTYNVPSFLCGATDHGLATSDDLGREQPSNNSLHRDSLVSRSRIRRPIGRDWGHLTDGRTT